MEQLAQTDLLQILQQQNEPVPVRDLNQGFIWTNNALLTMLGYTNDRILGAADQDLFPSSEAFTLDFHDRRKLFRTINHVMKSS